MLLPLPRIRPLWNSGHSHRSPCEEKGSEGPHRRLEQRRSWGTWIGYVQPDRSRPILGRLNALLFFLRQTLVCWVYFQDDRLLYRG